MNRCANISSRGPLDDRLARNKRASSLGSYAAFAGSVIFTLAAASALVTSDLPLPLFG